MAFPVKAIHFNVQIIIPVTTYLQIAVIKFPKLFLTFTTAVVMSCESEGNAQEPYV